MPALYAEANIEHPTNYMCQAGPVLCVNISICAFIDKVKLNPNKNSSNAMNRVSKKCCTDFLLCLTHLACLNQKM